MQLELVVTLNLVASHSLEEREAPHSHRWDIQIGLKGDLNQGRVVSLTEAQAIFQELLTPLQNSFLNNNSYLDAVVRAHPTCENLAFFLVGLFQKSLGQFKKTPTPILSFVQVGVWEDAGQLGFAKVSV